MITAVYWIVLITAVTAVYLIVLVEPHRPVPNIGMVEEGLVPKLTQKSSVVLGAYILYVEGLLPFSKNVNLDIHISRKILGSHLHYALNRDDLENKTL